MMATRVIHECGCRPSQRTPSRQSDKQEQQGKKRRGGGDGDRWGFEGKAQRCGVAATRALVKLRLAQGWRRRRDQNTDTCQRVSNRRMEPDQKMPVSALLHGQDEMGSVGGTYLLPVTPLERILVHAGFLAAHEFTRARACQQQKERKQAVKNS